jgi:hypothetical protein
VSQNFQINDLGARDSFIIIRNAFIQECSPLRICDVNDSKHMYIHTCICTYLYMYIPIYVHTCICTYLYMYIPIYVHTCICTYLYMYIPVYICTYLYMYIPVYVHTYICTYLYMYIPIYVHTYVHTYSNHSTVVSECDPGIRRPRLLLHFSEDPDLKTCEHEFLLLY